MKITIHTNQAIAWQAKRASSFVYGLTRIGHEPFLTDSRTRIDDNPAVLFGTSGFKAVEAVEGDWLLVDRASYDDPQSVQLGWNGHLRAGDHRDPDDWAERDSQPGVPSLAAMQEGERVVLCGQHLSYCDKELDDWYESRVPDCTHFKPHPVMADKFGREFKGLPVVKNFVDAGLVITLNSSIAIEALLHGIDALADAENAMAWRYSQGEIDRYSLFKWLAWTQWSWREIEAGGPIKHLFDWLEQ